MLARRGDVNAATGKSSRPVPKGLLEVLEDIPGENREASLRARKHSLLDGVGKILAWQGSDMVETTPIMVSEIV